MSRAAKSIAVWGVYMMVVGLGCLLIPNTILTILGLPTTTEVWIRVIGLLVVVFGAYYFYCARKNAIPFFRVTVPGGIVFAIGLVALVALGLSGPTLIIFGAMDMVGAIWTWMSSRATN